MGKLIDTDVLKAVLMETKAESGNIGEVIAMIFCGVIDEQPEAIVRCKDCKHRYEDDCSMRFVEIVQVDDDGYIDHEILYNDNTTDDGYCDCGERRTDETDRR